MTGNSSDPLARYLSTHPNAGKTKEPTKGERKRLREAETQARQQKGEPEKKDNDGK
jgi:hypothetical protein